MSQALLDHAQLAEAELQRVFEKTLPWARSAVRQWFREVLNSI